MKKTATKILGLILAIMPLSSAAQSNIQSAFNAIINCPEAKITESHNLERNLTTKDKSGQYDIYRFVLPTKQIKLVKNVLEAFNKDSDQAYSFTRGTTSSNDRPIQTAVGDGSGEGITITEEGRNYVYALFLAPEKEDPSGIYRYAYAMNYIEEDGHIYGKLITTYATTLEYRQRQAEDRRLNYLQGIDVNNTYTNSQQTWVDKIMVNLQSMNSANAQTRISLATRVYNTITDTKKYPEVSDTDKETIREILKVMIAEKKYSDPVLNKLLTRCLAAVK